MHVLAISLDPKILDTATAAAVRARAYGETVSKLTFVVPTPVDQVKALSDNVVIYGVGGGTKPWQLFRIYKKIASLVVSEKVDVIASSDMYFIGAVALAVARRFHIGFQVDVLGIEKLSPLRRAIASRVLQSASLVRALSHRLKERISREFGVTHDRVRVTSIFVPTDTIGLDPRTLDETDAHHYEALRSAFHTTYKQYKNFLSVSRLVPIKRIDLQLRALQQVIKTTPDVRLHIVGDGPSDETLRATAVQLGVTDHVVFHGRKTGYELGVFYQECDCFLLTSDYEGWGMVVVEAATAGTPVIMTDVGCAGEFLVHEQSGLVVPVGDVAALAAAMVRLATDSTLRQQLSYGTKHALASLEDFDTIVSQYKDNWQFAAAHKL